MLPSCLKELITWRQNRSTSSQYFFHKKYIPIIRTSKYTSVFNITGIMAIQEGCSLPSCAYLDKDSYPVLYVFLQDTSGWIRSRRHKGPWVASDPIVQAKLGSQFSAIGWYEAKDQSEHVGSILSSLSYGSSMNKCAITNYIRRCLASSVLYVSCWCSVRVLPG